jgi:site-specific DNA recombinase
MLRVHAYIRYSSVMQDDGFSVEYQIAEINDYCNRNGWILEKIHVDQALTAKQVAGREAFFDLLNCIVNSEVDVVIVYKMNRMFRNAEESHVYRKKFRQHGVKIISVTEPIDEQTSAGRLTANMLANLDQYQSEIIADFVRSSLREMTRQGYYIGGYIPLGYTLVEETHGKKKRKRYQILESEALHVKKCFELYADGFSLLYILHYLQDAGIKGRRGKSIGRTTLRRLLQNDMYIGTLRFVTEGYDDLIVPDAIPAIIDLDVWNRVQARHKANKPVAPRKHRELYPLTGKITCGYCGQHFFGISCKVYKSDGSPYHYKYYVCSKRGSAHKCSPKRIRKEQLEKIAISAIKQHILNDAMIKEIAQKAASMSINDQKDTAAEIKAIKQKIAEIDETIDLFIEMRRKNEMSPEVIRRKSDAAEAEMKRLQAELIRLEHTIKTAITPDQIETYLRNMLKNANSDDMDVLKSIFDNFIEEIVVTDDEIKIRLFVCSDPVLVYKKPTGQSGVRLYSNIKRK